MATTDLLRSQGIKPANLVDIGKGAKARRVVKGLELALSNSNLALLLNLFCSVTHCDEIARGILAAYGELSPDVPLVVRLEGENVQAAHELLAGVSEQHGHADLHLVESLGDAVRQVATLWRGDRGGRGR
jgi:succinyl-CoA synthetase beta subunit